MRWPSPKAHPDLRNGNGRCARCNLVKDTVGWTNEVRDAGAIVTTTPTGHRYTGRTPQPPRSRAWQRIRSIADDLKTPAAAPLTALERRLAVLLDLEWPGAG